MKTHRIATKVKFPLACLISFLSFGPLALLAEVRCPPPDDVTNQYILTDEFSVKAWWHIWDTRDVIRVMFDLHSRIVDTGQPRLSMAVCHDPDVIEMIGNPIYSEEFQSLTDGEIRFEEDAGRGFSIKARFNDSYEARFPSDSPLQMVSIDYRLKGSPRAIGQVTFCDGVLTLADDPCNLNELTIDEPGLTKHYLSTKSEPLRIIVPDPQPCPWIQRRDTDDFSLEAQSASGAAGDVVGVTFTLRSRMKDSNEFMLSVCHDPEVAEIVGKPMYTEEFLSLTNGVLFIPVNEGEPLMQVGHGFILGPYRNAIAFRARFPSETPLNIMTVYYRLKGAPGTTSEVTFCDRALKISNARCNDNFFSTYDDYYSEYYLSTENRPATLTVLEGPATHPDRPPEPSEAKVYPQRPTDEEINFQVRITGAAARPGATEVPVEVFVSADVEYSGIVIPVDFDERYLRLARAECHFLTGSVVIDNRDTHPGAGPDEGHGVILNTVGVNSWRIAAEGEEVHAATLYFDVLEAASSVPSTELTVTPVTGKAGQYYRPAIIVWCQQPVGINLETVQAEVSPLQISNGRMKILSGAPLFVRADSNADMAVDLSDAVFTINYLFLRGQPPLCPEAADANADGRIDISDPAVTLASLFLEAGGIPPPYPEPGVYVEGFGLACY
jgi:dockerin type I repeat protein